MDIKAEKIELIELLLKTDNPKIIQSIKQILKKEKAKDFWDELSPEQQVEIKQGMSDIQTGKITDYEIFMSKHR